MTTLNIHDLNWCLRRLPKPVVSEMKKRGDKLVVAGGYIRACVTGEPVSDIDCFTTSKESAEAIARSLCGKDSGCRMFETDNAYTVLGLRHALQFIHRWTFPAPADIIPSFDFTIARAAFWFETDPDFDVKRPEPHWESLCDDGFYTDLAGKRLIYRNPVRNEDAGGSMLRVLKFYQRGYRIPLDSLSAVIVRLLRGVEWEKVTHDGEESLDEYQLTKVLTGLLHEVDPNLDPEHLFHLESGDQAARDPTVPNPDSQG